MLVLLIFGIIRCSGESPRNKILQELNKKERKMRKQLKDLKAEHDNNRLTRKSNCVPTVAVVGYTNSGII